MTVIQVDDVWKKYRLGVIGTGTLRHDFERWWHRVRGKPDPHRKIGDFAKVESRKQKVTDEKVESGKRKVEQDFQISESPNFSFSSADDLGDDEVWALRGISFEVKQGEILGIIGRNGAGKSTLLKILSRVTAPTKGEVRVKGRIASLLEVGTGFHPELTGRENIFLNGAILGMTKAEVRGKLDEIIAFAGIETYIDTPVKRYSSGMYVRLAFAVAAHLDPEILIIDEVLAVGDVGFQRKCLRKMSDVAEREGRTVLFVSHSMPAVSRLCERCLFIEQGLLRLNAPTSEAVALYLAAGQALATQREWRDGIGSDVAALRSVKVRTRRGPLGLHAVLTTEEVGIEVQFEVLRPGHHLVPNCHFFNQEGTCLFVSHNWNNSKSSAGRAVGLHVSTVWLPSNFLNEGAVVVGVAVSTYDPFRIHFYERDAIAFDVRDTHDGSPTRGDHTGAIPGAVRPLLQWVDQTVVLSSGIQ